MEQTLTSWLSDLPLAKRKQSIEALFNVLGASEGKTTDARDNLKDIRNIFTKYSNLDEKTKVLLTDIVSSLSATTKVTITKKIKENIKKTINK